VDGRSRLEGRYSVQPEPLKQIFKPDTFEPIRCWSENEFDVDSKNTHAAKLQRIFSKSKRQRTDNTSHLQAMNDPFVGFRQSAILTCKLMERPHTVMERPTREIHQTLPPRAKSVNVYIPSHVIKSKKDTIPDINAEIKQLVKDEDLNLTRLLAKRKSVPEPASEPQKKIKLPKLLPKLKPVEQPERKSPSPVPEFVQYDPKLDALMLRALELDNNILSLADIGMKSHTPVEKVRSVLTPLDAPLQKSIVTHVIHIEKEEASTMLPKVNIPRLELSNGVSHEKDNSLVEPMDEDFLGPFRLGETDDSEEFTEFAHEEAISEDYEERERERQRRIAIANEGFIKACDESEYLLQQLAQASDTLKETLTVGDTIVRNRNTKMKMRLNA
jgi:hypothetical protein